MNECSLIILDREYEFLCYCTEFGDIEMKYVYLQETICNLHARYKEKNLSTSLRNRLLTIPFNSLVSLLDAFPFLP